MDWDKLKIFHAVAEAGSFTNATVNLNLSHSAISRQIQSLEQDLKVQLFERHARGLTLTENGEYVFKTAHEVISKLKEVETSLGDQKNKPTGKLTITTVRSFGTHWLTPRIQEFMRLNPEIEIELVFDDKELDLSTRQADIGIFMRRPKQLNYIQKKLVDIKYFIYGSNKYLEKHGMPKTVGDLNKHKFISFGKGAPSPVYVLNNTETWNGTNWTAVGGLNVARYSVGGAGASNTKALAFGGYIQSPPTDTTASTEEWNDGPQVKTISTS